MFNSPPSPRGPRRDPPVKDRRAARGAPAGIGPLGRLKSLLLDQSFLAGIGNLYADEILWESRIHPERAAASLTPRERGRRAHSPTTSR